MIDPLSLSFSLDNVVRELIEGRSKGGGDLRINALEKTRVISRKSKDKNIHCVFSPTRFSLHPATFSKRKGAF